MTGFVELSPSDTFCVLRAPLHTASDAPTSQRSHRQRHTCVWTGASSAFESASRTNPLSPARPPVGSLFVRSPRRTDQGIHRREIGVGRQTENDAETDARLHWRSSSHTPGVPRTTMASHLSHGFARELQKGRRVQAPHGQAPQGAGFSALVPQKRPWPHWFFWRRRLAFRNSSSESPMLPCCFGL